MKEENIHAMTTDGLRSYIYIRFDFEHGVQCALYMHTDIPPNYIY